jgi:ATP-dependent Clp protease ATP-binding subunit ClpC
MQQSTSLFERYTEAARRVISRAREQASGCASSQIEPDDLLIGLLREHNADRFIGSPETLDSIERRITSGETNSRTADNLGQPALQPYIKPCAGICSGGVPEHLNHRHIGTEHILLGLLREKGSLAAMILNELGLKVEALRKRLQTRS